MAIACLRLVTFFPDRPLFSFPLLRSCIAFFTFSFAFDRTSPCLLLLTIKNVTFRRVNDTLKSNSITQAQKRISASDLTFSLLGFVLLTSRTEQGYEV